MWTPNSREPCLYIPHREHVPLIFVGHGMSIFALDILMREARGLNTFEICDFTGCEGDQELEQAPVCDMEIDSVVQNPFDVIIRRDSRFDPRTRVPDPLVMLGISTVSSHDSPQAKKEFTAARMKYASVFLIAESVTEIERVAYLKSPHVREKMVGSILLEGRSPKHLRENARAIINGARESQLLGSL